MSKRIAKLIGFLLLLCFVSNLNGEHKGVRQLLPDGLESPDEIWAALDKIPVQIPLSDFPENKALRKELVAKLDKHMTYYKYHVYSPGSDDISYGNRDGTNNSQETPFTKAYRKRIQKVIDEINTIQPKGSEVIIWKLYSSGYLFKTPKYVFAVDLAEGPTIDNKKFQEERGKAFCMTVSQVRQLAEKVDFAFFSHHHIDHISYPFAALMIEKRKKIYGPNNPSYFYTRDLVEHYGTKGPYASLLSKITDPWVSDTSQYVIADGDFKVTILNGYQDWKNEENGTPTNFSYLIETDNGANIIYFGDQRTSKNHKNYPRDISFDWLLSLKNLGRNVDIKIGAGPLMHIKGTKNANDILREHFRPIIRIHGHEWEITHPKFGKYGTMWSNFPEEVEQVFPLTIGESFIYSK